MKIYVLILLLFLLALNKDGHGQAEFSDRFKLLPQPQKIELLKGGGLSFRDLNGVRLVGTARRPVMNGLLALLPLSTGSSSGVVTLKVEPEMEIPSQEGYVLEISELQVVIRAKDHAGLFYGIQTLEQLIQESFDQQIEIPAVRISDYPDIGYRAIHLDLKHHLDAVNYYYTMIDKLASVKINAVIIEFEDKLRYRKYPEVGAKNSISLEEFAMLGKYAKERNIEISPLIQGLGHASFILKHESMKDVRDDINSDWVFDPLNPRTYDVQFALYDDALAATPYGKFLHVGGDEVGDLGKSELSKKSGMSPFDLQMYWLKKVCEYAAQHGRTPIFWDDMVFKLSGLYRTTWDPDVPEDEALDLWKKNRIKLDESIELFPENCIYMRWNYSHPQLAGNILALDWYNSKGLKVMAATSAQQIWPMIPRDRSNFKAISDYSRITAEKKLQGILCTIWDDTSPHFETVWRGVFDFALSAWNHTDISIDAAHAIFRHRYYAPEASDASFEFQDLLEDVLPFWETALIARGDRSNYHKDFILIDLPDPSRPGSWSLIQKEKLEGARKSLAEYLQIKERLKKTNLVCRRNAFTVEVMSQVNELQSYSANLLLLLEKYDRAGVRNKQAVRKELSTFVDGFDKIRRDMEEVYSKTRILGNPEGYQLDSNLHEHLANGTNNTDWMYVYELPMNEKIREWLSQGDKK
jgi:hexosaminidase